MNTIYIYLGSNGEYSSFDIFKGVLKSKEDVENAIREHFLYCVGTVEHLVRTETDDYIYVGHMNTDCTNERDIENISDFNTLCNTGNYELAFYDCTRCPICFKKETI